MDDGLYAEKVKKERYVILSLTTPRVLVLAAITDVVSNISLSACPISFGTFCHSTKVTPSHLHNFSGDGQVLILHIVSAGFYK
jgi:hypothetical protein